MTASSRKLAAIMFSDIVGYTAVVGRDEARGVALRDRHARLVRTLVEQFGGRLVEDVGDESLSTFGSALDAVNCALSIQGVLENDPELKVRIGIHIGDILEQDGKLVGDGINLAARLRPLAEPGGICVSERVRDDLRSHPEIRAAFLGAKELKNVERPVRVYSLMRAAAGEPPPARRQRRLPRWLVAAGAALALAALLLAIPPVREIVMFQLLTKRILVPGPTYEQDIAFTRTNDGVRIAWSSAGAGPPVVIVLGWFTHLEEGTGPGWNLWVPALVDQHRMIQYDGRGSGLSDRGIDDFSLEAKLRDLEAVVEAAGLERFALYAISSGGPTAVAYAVRHPERVTRLAFYGAFLRIDGAPGNVARWRSMPAMVRAGWGEDNAAFRQVFTSLFMPDAAELNMRVFNHMQRVAATPEDAARFIESMIETDVVDLAPQVRAPALVAHVRGDQIVPYPLGREIAALIPGAHLLTLDGNNHMLFGQDAAFGQLNDALLAFFGED